jgi:hypothetical protein
MPLGSKRLKINFLQVHSDHAKLRSSTREFDQVGDGTGISPIRSILLLYRSAMYSVMIAMSTEDVLWLSTAFAVTINR